MALGSIQPLVKMSSRNIPGGKGGRCMRVTTSPPLSAKCHENWEPKPPGTLWAILGLLWDSFTFTFTSENYTGFSYEMCDVPTAVVLKIWVFCVVATYQWMSTFHCFKWSSVFVFRVNELKSFFLDYLTLKKALLSFRMSHATWLMTQHRVHKICVCSSPAVRFCKSLL